MAFFKKLFGGKKQAAPMSNVPQSIPQPSQTRPQPSQTRPQQSQPQPQPQPQPMPSAGMPARNGGNGAMYECANCGYTSNQPGGCPNCGIPLRPAGEGKAV